MDIEKYSYKYADIALPLATHIVKSYKHTHSTRLYEPSWTKLLGDHALLQEIIQIFMKV